MRKRNPFFSFLTNKETTFLSFLFPPGLSKRRLGTLWIEGFLGRGKERKGEVIFSNIWMQKRRERMRNGENEKPLTWPISICAKIVHFPCETIGLPVLSLLPPPSPPPVWIWVLNELGERFMEHHVRDYVNCLVLNLWKKN